MLHISNFNLSLLAWRGKKPTQVVIIFWKISMVFTLKKIHHFLKKVIVLSCYLIFCDFNVTKRTSCNKNSFNVLLVQAVYIQKLTFVKSPTSFELLIKVDIVTFCIFLYAAPVLFICCTLCLLLICCSFGILFVCFSFGLHLFASPLVSSLRQGKGSITLKSNLLNYN